MKENKTEYGAGKRKKNIVWNKENKTESGAVGDKTGYGAGRRTKLSME